MKIYSVFDKKVQKYGPLMSFPNDTMCIRAIEMDMNNSNCVIGAYPFDFCIVRVADFDDSTGIVTPLDMVDNIYECANFIKTSKMPATFNPAAE